MLTKIGSNRRSCLASAAERLVPFSTSACSSRMTALNPFCSVWSASVRRASVSERPALTMTRRFSVKKIFCGSLTRMKRRLRAARRSSSVLSAILFFGDARDFFERRQALDGLGEAVLDDRDHAFLLGGRHHLGVRGVPVDEVLERLRDLKHLVDAHAPLVAFAVALLAARAVEEIHLVERLAAFEEAVALEEFGQVGRVVQARQLLELHLRELVRRQAVLAELADEALGHDDVAGEGH